MYRVINTITGELVAMCSRKEDAEAYLNTNLPDAQYAIEHDDFVNKKVDTAQD